jgi:hypothetical protein
MCLRYLSLFFFILLTPSFAENTDRPNIIVFLVDDYDKPETSPYGGKVLTPTSTDWPRKE